MVVVKARIEEATTHHSLGGIPQEAAAWDSIGENSPHTAT
uniref:Uncharacterized protein n=1 Tax=Vitis vinifera TaxID=29760 RepID=F6HSI3_VITVI